MDLPKSRLIARRRIDDYVSGATRSVGRLVPGTAALTIADSTHDHRGGGAAKRRIGRSGYGCADSISRGHSCGPDRCRSPVAAAPAAIPVVTITAMPVVRNVAGGILASLGAIGGPLLAGIRAIAGPLLAISLAIGAFSLAIRTRGAPVSGPVTAGIRTSLLAILASLGALGTLLLALGAGVAALCLALGARIGALSGARRSACLTTLRALRLHALAATAASPLLRRRCATAATTATAASPWLRRRCATAATTATTAATAGEPSAGGRSLPGVATTATAASTTAATTAAPATAATAGEAASAATAATAASTTTTAAAGFDLDGR
jgi:hypothetical protein